MRVGTHGEQKKKPLEFELQVVGNCPWWVLETQPFYKVSVLLTPCVFYT